MNTTTLIGLVWPTRQRSGVSVQPVRVDTLPKRRYGTTVLDRPGAAVPYLALVEAVSATASSLPCTLNHSGAEMRHCAPPDARASFTQLCVSVAQLPIRGVLPILNKSHSTVAV